MATLIVNKIVEDGVAETLVAANGGGDDFVNADFNNFIVVANADTGAHVVTLTPLRTSTTAPGFGTVDRDPIVVSVAASETKFIGPIPEAFNDINGSVAITYDDVTSVTVGAFKLEASR